MRSSRSTTDRRARASRRRSRDTGVTALLDRSEFPLRLQQGVVAPDRRSSLRREPDGQGEGGERKQLAQSLQELQGVRPQSMTPRCSFRRSCRPPVAQTPGGWPWPAGHGHVAHGCDDRNRDDAAHATTNPTFSAALAIAARTDSSTWATSRSPHTRRSRTPTRLGRCRGRPPRAIAADPLQHLAELSRLSPSQPPPRSASSFKARLWAGPRSSATFSSASRSWAPTTAIAATFSTSATIEDVSRQRRHSRGNERGERSERGAAAPRHTSSRSAAVNVTGLGVTRRA
jgi:hypothetical protein